ncbi:MAG: UDP-N-acetylmuramate--L-alanine ligase [Synergistaceae bacterium]|jgi:UDP-N-acetylmuramate--alanine ligase|nr:UDP-N-acetylmuramate--L-alanine ligase [Synergistaceae bacterium]
MCGIKELDGVERVHLMGIGGAGMSALALLLSGMGFHVDGCDLSPSEYIPALEEQGIRCLLGHSSSHIEKFSPHLVAYSSAVNPDQEELRSARERGIPTVGRGRLLSWLFNARRGIGVAGAHGKTTTSSMIGLILERAGLDPTLTVGAEVCDIGTNARAGKSEFFVAEIDESDGSFEFFSPAVTAITNIDWDHVNYFPTYDDVLSAFVRFARARKPEAPLVICAEDEGSRSLIEKLRGGPGVVTCGWGKSWTWGAFDVTRKAGGGVSFSVARHGETLGRIDLAVSGEHNVMNALVACAAVSSLVPFGEIAETLSVFRGARRRLEKVGKKTTREGGLAEVLDDYAHHPAEIRATLSAVRDIYPGRRLVVLFQPHRFTRTAAFYRQFASALGGADAVLLLPVYAAGEEAPPGVTSALISGAMNEESSALCRDEEDAFSRLDSLLRGGDVLLTLGAGSVTHLGSVYIGRT